MYVYVNSLDSSKFGYYHYRFPDMPNLLNYNAYLKKLRLLKKGFFVAILRAKMCQYTLF